MQVKCHFYIVMPDELAECIRAVEAGGAVMTPAEKAEALFAEMAKRPELLFDAGRAIENLGVDG